MTLYRITSLLFAAGLAFMLLTLVGIFDLGKAPMLIGSGILDQSVSETGAANIVTAVVLGYRGIDTLGEIAILFTASAATALVLSGFNSSRAEHEVETPKSLPDDGLILRHSASLLFPLLLLVGLYIILHGHLTPGGGFQGGVLLAGAFFLPLLAIPGRGIHHTGLSIVEGLAGASFILIGIAALVDNQAFLTPMLSHGVLGQLWSAGTLPLLYGALGLKVGSELAGLLANLAQIPSKHSSGDLS